MREQGEGEGQGASEAQGTEPDRGLDLPTLRSQPEPDHTAQAPLASVI